MLRRQLAQWHKEQRVSLDKISRQQEALYKTLLQSHAEMRAIQRRRAINPDPLPPRQPPPGPDDGEGVPQVPPASRLPSLGDPKVEQWLQDHTTDMAKRRATNTINEQTAGRRNNSVDRLVIQRDADNRAEKQTQEYTGPPETAVADSADTTAMVSLDQIVLEPATATDLQEKSGHQKHKVIPTLVSNASGQESPLLLALQRTHKKQKGSVNDKKSKKFGKIQSNEPLNKSALLPPITEDRDEPKAENRLVEVMRPSTPAKHRIVPAIIVPVGDHNITSASQKGQLRPIKRQPQCIGKPWYSAGRAPAPTPSKQMPSVTMSMAPSVAPSEPPVEPLTGRSNQLPTQSLTKVTRRKRRLEERHRREVLNSESVVVYEHDNHGNIVPSVMEHHRRSFPLPSTRDQRIRQRLLASQQQAAQQQGDRMNAFIEQISEHGKRHSMGDIRDMI